MSISDQRMMSMPGTIGGARIVFKNSNMDKIGIIGLGFVGGAIKNALNDVWGHEVTCVDPAKGYTNTIADLADCDGVFVCVPTPQDDDGTCDTGPLEDVLRELSHVGFQGVIISKCTAPPDVYEELNEKYPNLVHSPEFLTAANANRDYANGKFCIIGGKHKLYLREAERIIRTSQQDLGDNVKWCSIGEAALAKYTINTFLATKVVFMNEINKLANKMDLDYNVIIKAVSMDPRIGNSHIQVPGPDGLFGFGGACFPKDTSALLKTAEQQGLDMMILDAAVKKNTFLRLTEPK